MKRSFFTLLSVMLLSVAAINASAQQTRSVSGFNAVATAGPFNVHIKIDGTESVKVDADSDIINDIETVVENNTLKIRFKDRNNRHQNIQKAEVYVTAQSLNALVNSGSGSIKVEDVINTGDFKIVLSGSGSISTAVKSSSLNAIITGSGSIKLKGTTGDADLKISGSGEIDGRDLKTESDQVVITGSGNIHIIAEKGITARITGSGNVNYTGNATVINTRYLGSGRVNKED
jgi:hypothetical protein